MEPAPSIAAAPTPGTRPPACPACHAQLPAEPDALEALAACPRCSRALTVTVFPAYRHPPARGPAAPPAADASGAACFVHDGRPAVAACEQCGRFLCAVCELELDGQPWCAGCLEAARATGRLARLERRRIRWDLAAGYLLAGSLLLCSPLLLLTAPAAMVLAGSKLQAPPSRVARSRLRLILVFPVALLLLGGLATLALIGFFQS